MRSDRRLRNAIANPQLWNRYSYIAHNSSNYADPSGTTIQYKEVFRRRLKSDPAFKAGKRTESGKAQWKKMRDDKDTAYRLTVREVKVPTLTHSEPPILWSCTFQP
jgi:hypothetical protein